MNFQQLRIIRETVRQNFNLSARHLDDAHPLRRARESIAPIEDPIALRSAVPVESTDEAPPEHPLAYYHCTWLSLSPGMQRAGR